MKCAYLLSYSHLVLFIITINYIDQKYTLLMILISNIKNKSKNNVRGQRLCYYIFQYYLKKLK